MAGEPEVDAGDGHVLDRLPLKCWCTILEYLSTKEMLILSRLSRIFLYGVDSFTPYVVRQQRYSIQSQSARCAYCEFG